MGSPSIIQFPRPISTGAWGYRPSIANQLCSSNPLAPPSFPGEIWTHLVPQSAMSLLHLLAWSLNSSLWLLTALPVTQDLSLKSQWNYSWVQPSLVRTRNPGPRKIFNFSHVTHRGWGDRSVPFTFSLLVQTVMKTKSAAISCAALPCWVKVTRGGWSLLFNFVYIFHQRILCLCLFLTSTCPVTICPVTAVLIRLKQFLLLAGSSPLKPFALLVTLAVENRLREKFPAGCICIFAHLAISRQVNRAMQQFQLLCGVECTCTVSISVLYCSDGGANKISVPDEQRESRIALTVFDPFGWSFPRIHSLLEPSFFNRNYSLIPPFTISPADLLSFISISPCAHHK